MGKQSHQQYQASPVVEIVDLQRKRGFGGVEEQSHGRRTSVPQETSSARREVDEGKRCRLRAQLEAIVVFFLKGFLRRKSNIGRTKV